jgi:hypothetical protein
MIRSALPALAAALLGAAAPTPDAPAPPVHATLTEAPPPEAPGRPAAEVGAAEAQAHGEGRTWFALPMLFWLPETQLGFAATAGVHFHVGGAAEASNAFAIAGYSIRGQGSLDLSSDAWLPRGTLLSARLRAVHYPDSFYGVGPETTLAMREEMTRRFVEATLGAEVPVVGRLRAGPRLHGRAEEIRDVPPGGLVAARAVDGATGFSAVGFGLALTWDSRDRKLFPRRGTYAQAYYLHYPSSLGRNDGFSRAGAEGRLFLPSWRGGVLGLAALFEETRGATPFSLLSKLGSTRFLRGIREGRYRDDLAWAAQAELRVPIAGPVIGAVFGAVGDVGPDLASFRARTLKLGGGAGLRYRLTGEGANLRVDLAVADGGPEVYVLLLEAF